MICKVCGQEKQLIARGMCSACYQREYRRNKKPFVVSRDMERAVTRAYLLLLEYEATGEADRLIAALPILRGVIDSFDQGGEK